MRLPRFIPLLLLACTHTAQASSDNFCSPSWVLTAKQPNPCSSLAFLSPANDSRVNLQLLLADAGRLQLSNQAPSDDELVFGYAQVPFDVSRLLLPPSTNNSAVSEPDATTAAPVDPQLQKLIGLLEQLGLPRDEALLGDDQPFAEGEGNRQRSNNRENANAFLSQLLASELPAAERQALALQRLQLLHSWRTEQAESAAAESAEPAEPAEQSESLPATAPASAAAAATPITSALGQQFATYLHGASAFYTGDFSAALADFQALRDSPQPWLKQAALYMLARTELNAAQAQAFDEWGMLESKLLDQAALNNTDMAFRTYLSAYPQGSYAQSAKGLLRKVYWLQDDQSRLAAEYAEQFAANTGAQDGRLTELTLEVDDKLLLNGQPENISDPLLLATLILGELAPHSKPADNFTQARLSAQQSRFSAQPQLYNYLQSALYFYLDQDPAKTLSSLPPLDASQPLTYLSFSQQSLRGFALEAQQDWAGAQALWLQLLPLAKQPLQHAQLELALAFNYERAQQLDKVFANDSPIQTQQLRDILLRNVAGPELLRARSSAASSSEESQLALFSLLYKDLLRGHYQDFLKDLALLPQPLPAAKLTNRLDLWYGEAPSLALFQWPGGSGDAGYNCPALRDVATLLASNPQDAKGLNCLGEFIRSNGLDSFPLDQQPPADELGGSRSQFGGKRYSRLDGYLQVLAAPTAANDERAYALYRAINCFAPSGYNGCGPQEIAQAQRKQWFQSLKSQYPKSPWAQSLKYYW
ncbi:MAG: outer membrane assembly lipoprotein YfiO [Pseudomonas sp.]|uniref:outer membrane assembly lipoprotein YfiO n=1 Tax=Pseudomonas sp. TaxID=306 RepID=UPI00273705BE|nr:outer membrane assembly lipoprotein YfiO [Pseudomonas sp.]MDP3847044.1 outer membrane assembly lipoprotein YfiO [Pseudomonas sp.]